MSAVDELEAVILHQMEVIDQLTESLGRAAPKDPYWERVYDDIRAAWDAWALVTLGTSTPSHLDLVGKPELAELWESVR